MTKLFSYIIKSGLDQAHSAEFYSESVTCEHLIPVYFKAISLSFFGLLLVLFTKENAFAAWFFFSLGILKTISVYDQKLWRVAQKMLSKVDKDDANLILHCHLGK